MFPTSSQALSRGVTGVAGAARLSRLRSGAVVEGAAGAGSWPPELPAGSAAPVPPRAGLHRQAGLDELMRQR